MTWGDGMDNEPRTISKRTFECLVLATIVLLAFAETFAAFVVGRALRLRNEGGYVGGLTVLNLVLARVAVNGILKRFGLSRSGKTLEVRGKTVAFAEGEVADDEVVEVRFSNSFVRYLFWGCLVGCVFLSAMGTLMLGRSPWEVVLNYLLGAFFGLGAINIWWDRKPQAWADRDGITGYPSGFHPFRQFVPWSDVATCEIETFYNTFGEPVLVRPILKGWDGKSLLALYLLYTRMEDQERLTKYIKAKLPKPKPTPEDDFWE